MPTSAATRRVTVTLDTSLVSKLDFISSKLRCSRASLLAVIIGESADPLVSIASCLPDPDQPVDASDARRFRGESARIIGEQVTKLLAGDAQNDMFSK